ncbi:unnamed protein product [Coccothraustes coccothraustes]
MARGSVLPCPVKSSWQAAATAGPTPAAGDACLHLALHCPTGHLALLASPAFARPASRGATLSWPAGAADPGSRSPPYITGEGGAISAVSGRHNQTGRSVSSLVISHRACADVLATHGQRLPAGVSSDQCHTPRWLPPPFPWHLRT